MGGAHEEVPGDVHDGEPDAVALEHADTAPGLGVDVVDRAQQVRLLLEVGNDLAPVVGVVAERDRVHAGGEHLLGDLRRDAEAAGGVLAVDDHESRLVALAQRRQRAQQGAAPAAADDVAHEEDARGRLRHSIRSD